MPRTQYSLFIERLKNCTIIKGSIWIILGSFEGFQEWFDNFTTSGVIFSPMHPSDLNVLSSVKEITGSLRIEAHHPEFTSLDVFRNVETIGGREQTSEYFSALYILKSSLISLNLKSLKEITFGSVFIVENEELCYVDKCDWRPIVKSANRNRIIVVNNRKKQKCVAELKTCDNKCRISGCWGPGKSMCLPFNVDNDCRGR